MGSVNLGASVEDVCLEQFVIKQQWASNRISYEYSIGSVCLCISWSLDHSSAAATKSSLHLRWRKSRNLQFTRRDDLSSNSVRIKISYVPQQAQNSTSFFSLCPKASAFLLKRRHSRVLRTTNIFNKQTLFISQTARLYPLHVTLMNQHGVL